MFQEKEQSQGVHKFTHSLFIKWHFDAVSARQALARFEGVHRKPVATTHKVIVYFTGYGAPLAQ